MKTLLPLTRPVGATLCLVAAMVNALQAEEPIRTWRDARGQFELQAKLLKHEDGKVHLSRGDGRVIEVPFAKLSRADQSYLEQAKEKNVPSPPTKTGAAIPISPTEVAQRNEAFTTAAATSKALPPSNRVDLLKQAKSLPALPADPLPYQRAPVAFTASMDDADSHTKYSLPLVVDPQQSLFAVSAFRSARDDSESNLGQLYLAAPSQQKATLVYDLPSTLQLLDHHVPSHRSLAVMGVKTPLIAGGDLVLLGGLNTPDPSLVARFTLPNPYGPGFAPQVHYAQLIDSQHAIVHFDIACCVYDLMGQKLIYSFAEESGSLACSPGRKYLAVSQEGQITLLNAIDGVILGSIATGSPGVPTLSFSPDGTTIAILTGWNIAIWDLTLGKVIAERNIIDSPGANLGWIDNRFVLLSLGGLFDTKLNDIVWRYPTLAIYSSTYANSRMSIYKAANATALEVAPMPHEGANTFADYLATEGDAAYLLKPGTEVSLMIEPGHGLDQQAIDSMLNDLAADAGWKVSSDSPVVLYAKFERTRPQSVKYAVGPLNGFTDKSVDMVPFTTILEIRFNEHVLVKRRVMNKPPSSMELAQGEAIEQIVQQYEQPDANYFRRMQVPKKILHPAAAIQRGSSQYQNGDWID